MIGERIKALRKSKGLSQTAFGAPLGANRDVINNAENGRAVVSDMLIAAIAREYNVSPEWLRFGTGEMSPPRSREEEIAAFFGELSRDPDGSIRKAFIAGLAQLDTDAWRAISDWITATFGIQSSPPPDDDAEK